MPDGADKLSKFFPKKPTPNEIQQFQAFVRETKRPEAYPLLWHDPPDRNATGHVLCCRFYVARRERPNFDFIPCSSCNGTPKFSDGYLVWSPDGRIRLVGNCCGPRYFGSEFRAMKKAAKEEVLQEAYFDYLTGTLPRVPSLLTDVESLAGIAGLFHSYRQTLERRVPTLWKALASSNGTLSVIHHLSDEERAQRAEELRTKKYEVMPIWHLRGTNFFTSSDTVSALRRWTWDLRNLRLENVLDVCDWSPEQLKDNAKRLRLTIRGACGTYTQLRKMAEFFAPENLAGIRDWCRHPDNVDRNRFTVSLTADTFTVSEYGELSCKIELSERLRPPRCLALEAEMEVAT